MKKLVPTTLCMSQLTQVRLPSTNRNAMGGRTFEEFLVAPALAIPLADAYFRLMEKNPNSFITIRTFWPRSSQLERYAEYKTGKLLSVTAPAGFSAREVGRSIDIDVSEMGLQAFFDEDESYFAPLTVADIQAVFEPLGFINVQDGRVERAKIWAAEGGELHLEYWADLCSMDEFTQALRDSLMTSSLSDLYDRAVTAASFGS